MKKKNLVVVMVWVTAVIACRANAGMTLQPKEVLVEGDSRDIRDFYIFQYELTVGEYKRYLELSGDHYDFDEWRYYDGPLNDKITSEMNPMSNMDFMQVVRFANWLSRDHGLKPAYTIGEDQSVEWDRKAKGYRVPTSDEWEWAARGGVLSKGYTYPGSDNLDEVAWHGKNVTGGKLPEVGTKKPNELGLYDMFGSVAEWCWDQYIVTTSEESLGIEGERTLTVITKRYAIPYTAYNERLLDISLYDGIRRVSRGGFFLGAQKLFTYQTDTSLGPDHLGEDTGIRLVRNAR
jgi:formylglycine-generating enzyme required for sulfatase activity